jgi:hypothetical protein
MFPVALPVVVGMRLKLVVLTDAETVLKPLATVELSGSGVLLTLASGVVATAVIVEVRLTVTVSRESLDMGVVEATVLLVSAWAVVKTEPIVDGSADRALLGAVEDGSLETTGWPYVTGYPTVAVPTVDVPTEPDVASLVPTSPTAVLEVWLEATSSEGTTVLVVGNEELGVPAAIVVSETSPLAVGVTKSDELKSKGHTVVDTPVVRVTTAVEVAGQSVTVLLQPVI